MLSFQNQFFVISQAFFLGCLLEFIYEFHSALSFLFGLRGTKVKRVCTIRSKNGNGLIRRLFLALWDFFYLMTISPICAIFLFGVNNGIVRWYIVIACIIGFAIFKITVGRIQNFIFDLTVYGIRTYVFMNALKFLKAIFKKLKITKKTKTTNNRKVLFAINRKQG